MGFSMHNRALIRGLLAGVVVLAGASACSRDNRTETGTVRDTSAVISTDTASTQTTNAPSTPEPDQSASVAGSDTSAAAETAAPRSKTGAARGAIQDTSAAGYRSMERDTSAAAGVNAPSDTARAPADTVLPGDQSSVAPSDTAPMEVAGETTVTDTSTTAEVAAGQDSVSAEVAADTSTTVGVAAGQDTVSAEIAATDTSVTTDVAAGQDTVSAEIATPDTSGHQAAIADSSIEMSGAAVTTDTAAQAPTADTVSVGYPETALDTSAAPTAADSGVIQAQIDTTHTDSAVAVEGEVSAEADIAAAGEADTAVAVGDSAVVSAQADTTADVPTEVAVQDDPIRLPEDTTEIAGGVTSEQYADTADMREEDRETLAQAEARTEEVGAARIGGEVTGAVALAGTTFQGAQCVVADNASDEPIVLDMSNTPASLNPCGLGSMVPSRFWTRRE